MVDITRLLGGKSKPTDLLRYGPCNPIPPDLPLRSDGEGRPVVVWNLTRRCNLSCPHCYAEATSGKTGEELPHREARALIDDLAHFGVPVLLFSGGEPLLREDLYQLGDYASSRGIRTVISTNGTLLDHHAARKIKEAGFAYVGVSLDGLEEVHDRFRGRRGAFQSALSGIRECRELGIKVGIRFTICRQNYQDIDGVLDLWEQEKIARCCFYHLVYTGRGRRLMDQDISLSEKRSFLDRLIARAEWMRKDGREGEILTVDNHADGVYLYLRFKEQEPERAAEIYRLLRRNGGNSSGIRIACIDAEGNVHPDQFWQHYSLGNVLERPFSLIWQDLSDPLLRRLRNRKGLVRGKCSRCLFFDLCNGNFRVRAEAAYGDTWAEDPACYLTAGEVQGVSGSPARCDS